MALIGPGSQTEWRGNEALLGSRGALTGAGAPGGPSSSTTHFGPAARQRRRGPACLRALAFRHSTSPAGPPLPQEDLSPGRDLMKGRNPDTCTLAVHCSTHTLTHTPRLHRSARNIDGVCLFLWCLFDTAERLLSVMERRINATLK